MARREAGQGKDGVRMVRWAQRLTVLAKELEGNGGDVKFDQTACGYVTWMHLESEKAMAEENA